MNQIDLPAIIRTVLEDPGYAAHEASRIVYLVRYDLEAQDEAGYAATDGGSWVRWELKSRFLAEEFEAFRQSMDSPPEKFVACLAINRATDKVQLDILYGDEARRWLAPFESDSLRTLVASVG